MADPDNTGSKSIEDVVSAAEDAGFEIEFQDEAVDEQATDDEGEAEENQGGDDEAPESATGGSDGMDYDPDLGRRWINEIRDREGEVIPNDFDTPSIELIVPRDIDDEAKALVNSWRAGADHNVRKLSPSFDDDPDIDDGVVDALTSIQFYAEDPENTQSVGYDLESIVDVLENDDIPYLWTKSSLLQDDLPT